MEDSKSRSDSFRRDLKVDGNISASSWADAIRDLEESSGDVEKKPSTMRSGTDATQPEKRVMSRDETSPELAATSTSNRLDELRHSPAIKMEAADMKVMVGFTDMIAKVNDAGKSISALRKSHPDYFPERMLKMWSDNLKETSIVMMKELHAMRNGRQQKKYDKRCVCKICSSVFMVPLASDQICDSCKAATVPKGGGSYGRKVDPTENRDVTGDDKSGSNLR